MTRTLLSTSPETAQAEKLPGHKGEPKMAKPPSLQLVNTFTKEKPNLVYNFSSFQTSHRSKGGYLCEQNCCSCLSVPLQRQCLQIHWRFFSQLDSKKNVIFSKCSSLALCLLPTLGHAGAARARGLGI